MEILNRAIEIEGGVGKLAVALGVAPNVVSNWRMRNELPRPWQIALDLKYAKRMPGGAAKGTRKAKAATPQPTTEPAAAGV
jgi:hypothetical protein